MALPWSTNAEPVRVLARHADAGDRNTWSGPDDLRPLSTLGRLEARHLVSRLEGVPFARVLASPALRCQQTVAPLARALGLTVETCRLLAADADPAELGEYLRHPETGRALLCTHRETVLGLFALYAGAGSRYIDGIAHMQKAAAWALHGELTGPPHVSYLGPPAQFQEAQQNLRAAPA